MLLRDAINPLKAGGAIVKFFIRTARADGLFVTESEADEFAHALFECAAGAGFFDHLHAAHDGELAAVTESLADARAKISERELNHIGRAEDRGKILLAFDIELDVAPENLLEGR